MGGETTPFDWHRMFIGDHPILFTGEILFRTVVIYVFTVALVRLLGKRGMRQLTPFELVIIIALGSAVGDPMFYADVPLLHGMAVIATIVFLQTGLEHLTTRSATIERIMESDSSLVVLNGRLQWKEMRREETSRNELFEQLRERGVENLAQVRAALIEPSGNLSVFYYADHDGPDLGLSILPPALRTPVEPVEAVVCDRCAVVSPSPAGDCPRCGGRDTWTAAERPPGRNRSRQAGEPATGIDG